MEFVNDWTIATLAALTSAILCGVTGSYLQLKAVELNRASQYTIGRWIGMYLTFVLPVSAVYVWQIVFSGSLSPIPFVVLAMVSAYLVSLGMGLDGDSFIRSREFYVHHDSDDEHWTDAWARGDYPDEMQE